MLCFPLSRQASIITLLVIDSLFFVLEIVVGYAVGREYSDRTSSETTGRLLGTSSRLIPHAKRCCVANRYVYLCFLQRTLIILSYLVALYAIKVCNRHNREGPH